MARRLSSRSSRQGQAIATQTLTQHANERDAFIARLHALGRAHDLLTSKTWEKAPLRAIVTRVLEPFQEKLNERITIDGPDDLWLDSTKSVAVAMVLHELATNAVKYGALSNGSGRVTIAWEQCQANRVKLVWQENGGPKVSLPKQNGFGSHLIERAFGASLAARNSCSVHKVFLAFSNWLSSRIGMAIRKCPLWVKSRLELGRTRSPLSAKTGLSPIERQCAAPFAKLCSRSLRPENRMG